MNTQEKKDTFLELRIKGETFEAIAKNMQVSKQTLINWSKEAEIQEAIEIARNIRYQAILNKFQATKKDRIEFYSLLSQKVKEELKKREFLDIKVDKLLDIALKCDNKLGDLSAGKLFGGGSKFGDWDTDIPSYYFNPED